MQRRCIVGSTCRVTMFIKHILTTCYTYRDVRYHAKLSENISVLLDQRTESITKIIKIIAD